MKTLFITMILLLSACSSVDSQVWKEDKLLNRSINNKLYSVTLIEMQSKSNDHQAFLKVKEGNKLIWQKSLTTNIKTICSASLINDKEDLFLYFVNSRKSHLEISIYQIQTKEKKAKLISNIELEMDSICGTTLKQVRKENESFFLDLAEDKCFGDLIPHHLEYNQSTKEWAEHPGE